MTSSWSNWAIAASTVAVLAFYYDFKSWQNYGARDKKSADILIQC
jgi:hypothetical protein